MDKRSKDNKTNLRCLVPDCTSDLRTETVISIRVLVCKTHRRAEAIESATKIYRYCQQCTKIHELDKFEARRRSCRAALDRHNMLRRRKASNHGGRSESIGSASRLVSSSFQGTEISAPADDTTTAYASAASDRRTSDPFSQAVSARPHDGPRSASKVAHHAHASEMNSFPEGADMTEASHRATNRQSESGLSCAAFLPSDIESDLRRIDEWIARATDGPGFLNAWQVSAGMFSHLEKTDHMGNGQYAGQGLQQTENASHYQAWQDCFGNGRQSPEAHNPQPHNAMNVQQGHGLGYPGDQAAASSAGWQNMMGEQHIEAYNSEPPSGNNFHQQMRFDKNQQASPHPGFLSHQQLQKSLQDGNVWEENSQHVWQRSQFDYSSNPSWPSMLRQQPQTLNGSTSNAPTCQPRTAKDIRDEKPVMPMTHMGIKSDPSDQGRWSSYQE